MKVPKRCVCFALTLTAITLNTMLVYGQKARPANDSLAAKIRRFAPTILTANTSHLAPNDRKALLKIIDAAKLYDALYLRQIWSGNEALLTLRCETKRNRPS